MLLAAFLAVLSSSPTSPGIPCDSSALRDAYRFDSVTAQRIRRIERGLSPAIAIRGIDDQPTSVEARMRRYHVPGVSVAVIDGYAVAWAKGYGTVSARDCRPVTPATLFQAGSISKSVAAATALRVSARGVFSIDADVNSLLRSWKLESEASTRPLVTPRQLISHTGGVTVHGFEGYTKGAATPTLAQLLSGRPPANSPPVRVDLPPGTAMRYSGGGYMVLEQLLEDVTGKRFPVLAAEEIMRPLGMSSSGYVLPQAATSVASGHDSEGKEWPGGWNDHPEHAAASLWSTPTDLARFLITVQQAHRGRGDPALAAMLKEQRDEAGLGFFLRHTEPGHRPLRFSHTGATNGYRAMVMGYVDGGRGIAVMTSGDTGSDLLMEIVRSVAVEYGWPDLLPSVKTVQRIDAREFSRYAGEYRVHASLSFVVASDLAGLTFAQKGRAPRPLLAESDTAFFLRAPGDPTVLFTRGTDGRMSGLTFRRESQSIKATRVDSAGAGGEVRPGASRQVEHTPQVVAISPTRNQFRPVPQDEHVVAVKPWLDLANARGVHDDSALNPNERFRGQALLELAECAPESQNLPADVQLHVVAVEVNPVQLSQVDEANGAVMPDREATAASRRSHASQQTFHARREVPTCLGGEPSTGTRDG